jgi:hypothetical protein
MVNRVTEDLRRRQIGALFEGCGPERSIPALMVGSVGQACSSPVDPQRGA